MRWCFKGYWIVAERMLLKSKTIGVDATTLEANAALHLVALCDTGEQYNDFFDTVAKESSIRNAYPRAVAEAGSQGSKKGPTRIRRRRMAACIWLTS